MKLEAALVCALGAAACAPLPPGSSPKLPPRDGGVMVSEFRARAWGPGPSSRFRGILAWDEKGRVRAEIAAPSVATPLILVVTPEGVLAASVSDRAFYRGDAAAPVLERLAGIPLSAQLVPRLLDPEAPLTEGPCVARRGRYRTIEDARRVATRLAVRCDTGGLKLFLDSPRVAPVAGREPFALEPGAGFRATTLDDLAATIESALRESR